MSNIVKQVGEAIPARIRFWIYVVYGIGSPIVVYATSKEWLGVDEVALWTSLGAVVGATGASNVTHKNEAQPKRAAKKVVRQRRPRGKARNRGG